MILAEIGSRAAEFEAWHGAAKALIPTVNLNRVFPAELEYGGIRLENFLGHWGNVSIEELCKICLVVKWLQPRRILELGTYNGMTTLQMALNAPPGCATYTLDLTPEQAASLSLSKLDELVARQFRAKFNTATGSYFAGRKELNIRQLLGNTAEFDYSLIDGPLDLIFVDAAHDYENKRIDTENAFRLLSPNGVILWHDYAQVANPD
ncbi:MAG TPA: class I SAM-dependent methyltransferase, partial [Rhizomicrobium sp.]|nr:class I SAM-dependent methyltransferase [Rhizomicrobium sp.]